MARTVSAATTVRTASKANKATITGPATAEDVANMAAVIEPTIESTTPAAPTTSADDKITTVAWWATATAVDVAAESTRIADTYPSMVKSLKPRVRATVTRLSQTALLAGDIPTATALVKLSNNLSTPVVGKAAKVVDYDLFVAERIVSLVVAAHRIMTGDATPELAGADTPANLAKVAEHVARLTGNEAWSTTLSDIAATADGVESNIDTLSAKVATERVTARAASARLAGPILESVRALTTTNGDWITPRAIYNHGTAGLVSDLPNGFASEGAIAARINDGACTIAGLESRAATAAHPAGFRLAD